jgi:CRP-like cAMP-binding protein
LEILPSCSDASKNLSFCAYHMLNSIEQMKFARFRVQDSNMSTEAELSSILSTFPLFSHLSLKQLESFSGLCKKREFIPGDIIVHEGDVAIDFFLIVKGQVEVKRGSESLAKLGRGQFFGESALVDDESRSADVVAVQQTSCATLTRVQFRELVASDPQISLRLLQELTRRYRKQKVSESLPNPSAESESAIALSSFEFKDKIAKRVFEKLVDSFVHDYMKKNYPQERSGWRTLSELAKELGTSTATLYGRGNQIAPAINEPANRGLVEIKIFPGGRGRGGDIMKVRVAYDKDPVKNYVNHRIRSKP